MIQIKKALYVFTLASFSLSTISCDKDVNLPALTEGEAVEIIESALQGKAGGLTSNLEDMAEQLVNAITSGEICDSLYMNTVEKEHQGTQIQASYTSEMTYEMSCNSLDVPQTATFSSTTESMYSTLKVDSDNDALFSGNASGIQPSSPSIGIQGNYSQIGTQEASFSNQRTVNSTFTVDLTDMAINKESFDIESGTGTFSFSGTTEVTQFAHEGSLVFNGDDTATLTINGNTYVIELN